MPGQRLDKWLWCSRLAKTRSGAQREDREPAAQPPVRESGPVEGGRGNREVPPAKYREPLPPSVSLELVAELSDGLVCLSGCARRGLGVVDPNGAARLAQAFGRERFLVELQRPFERGDARRNALLRDLKPEDLALLLS